MRRKKICDRDQKASPKNIKEKRVSERAIRELRVYLVLSRHGNYEYRRNESRSRNSGFLKKSSECGILSILIFLMAACHTFHSAAARPALPPASHPFATYCKSIMSGKLRVVKFIALSTVKHAQNAYARYLCRGVHFYAVARAVKVQNFALKETLAWPECTCRDVLPHLLRELAAEVNYARRTAYTKVNRMKVTLNKHPRISSMRHATLSIRHSACLHTHHLQLIHVIVVDM